MAGLSICRACVLLFFSAGMVVGQSAPSGTVSAALRAHLKDERFDAVTSIRGLPLGVRDELQTLWRSATLDIADPGADSQGTAVANRSLPGRRLVAAGCSADHHCLIHYERSGSKPAWLVVVYQWSPTATRFVAGGTAPSVLKTLDDVRRVLLSGSLKPADRW